MKALIIDDERLARNALRRLLKSHTEVEIVGEAANAKEGAAAIGKLHPDLIFLDIEMPGGSGFDMLQELDDVPVTIFTTAYDAYAVRAFEASALDYLVKPVAAERLAVSLARVKKALSGASEGGSPGHASRSAALQQIFVRDGDRCWIVRLSDIFLMESEGNYTRLWFGAERPLILRSLSAIEQRLGAGAFFRANRSQMINLRAVEGVEEEIEGRLIVRLPKGKLVEISRRQSSRLRQVLSL